MMYSEFMVLPYITCNTIYLVFNVCARIDEEYFEYNMLCYSINTIRPIYDISKVRYTRTEVFD